MKKFLSLLLAVLMALSVFTVAGAEAPAAEATQLSVPDMSSAFGGKAFASKYLEEGQREVLDISFQLGDSILAAIPEEFKAAIEQLLGALKFQSSTQLTAEQGQQSIRILLSDESVFDVSVAVGEKGLYLGSNILGDKVLQVTTEQINKSLKKVLKKIKKAEKEQANETTAMAETIQSLLTELGILSAVEDIVNGMSIQAVGDVMPADALFKPAVVMTVPVTKEALTNITTSLGIAILGMAGSQEDLGISMDEDSQEQLMTALNSLPEKLVDDIELRIYVDETGKKTQVGFDMAIMQDDGSVVPMSMQELSETKDDGVDIIAAFTMIQNETEISVDCEISQKQEGNKGDVDLIMIMTATNGDQKTAPLQATGTLTWTDEEAARNARGEIRAEVQAGATPQVVLMTLDFTDKDLGDHAKTDLAYTMGLEDGGALLTVKVDGKTDQAEAYIITEDALKPSEMDEEARQAFMNDLQVGAAQLLTNLMTKLPEAAQQLFAQLMSGGMQQVSPSTAE